ncbi:IS1595 family transposase [Paenibacillus antri]|uniref:IS1595 family transposase n=2 Tax=Paenibacillus antri TaxID=2582848 RepID=A0A5R9GJB3_9BACL|nr:IS1595 family transposase [Paenibacillus antri]
MNTDLHAYFFQRRWPNGFECPNCGFGMFYTIRTRRLPLYQCGLCKHQTTVTAGTVMHRSRTPLEKWAAAMDLLASEAGVNAAELAASIGVAHSTAWAILRKLRAAISEIEGSTLLRGSVQAAVCWLAPGYLFLSTSHKRYRKERIVLIGGSVDDGGVPHALKLTLVDDELLEPGTKELAREGIPAAFGNIAVPFANTALLIGKRLVQSALPTRFKEAERWLLRKFHGIGTKYLQSYLHEYCYRWNIAARGACPRTEWARLFFRTQAVV